ncbi:MAG: hypothetical protein IK000_09715 [Bacteroidaceae bacterium]|nr:hypothetical protein [Bacteroidaceae bacterium]
MKKFFLGCLALASLMLMSCLPDNGGYSYTTSFGRIVTIDHSSSPIRFICDCTGEVYEPENVKSDEELPMNLRNVERAFVMFYLEMNYTESHVTFTSGNPLTISSVYNKDLVDDGKFQPLYGFTRLQFDNAFSYPYGWVTGSYLNITPVVKSTYEAEMFLVPEAASGDTLSFSLYSKYVPSDSYLADFTCFDLRTLADTADASDKAKSVMKEMIDFANERDSVMVVVVGDYVSADTIIKAYVPTNHFKLRL